MNLVIFYFFFEGKINFSSNSSVVDRFIQTKAIWNFENIRERPLTHSNESVLWTNREIGSILVEFQNFVSKKTSFRLLGQNRWKVGIDLLKDCQWSQIIPWKQETRSIIRFRRPFTSSQTNYSTESLWFSKFPWRKIQIISVWSSNWSFLSESDETIEIRFKSIDEIIPLRRIFDWKDRFYLGDGEKWLKLTWICNLNHRLIELNRKIQLN